MGGKEKNEHADKGRGWGRGPSGKIPVHGIMQRGSFVQVFVSLKPSAKALCRRVAKYVPRGRVIFSDEHRAYRPLARLGYAHHFVMHSTGDDASDGGYHTNNIKGFWAHLKRKHNGTHHWTSLKYMQSYIDEFVFLFNTRKMASVERMKGLACNLLDKAASRKL